MRGREKTWWGRKLLKQRLNLSCVVASLVLVMNEFYKTQLVYRRPLPSETLKYNKEKFDAGHSQGRKRFQPKMNQRTSQNPFTQLVLITHLIFATFFREEEQGRSKCCKRKVLFLGGGGGYFNEFQCHVLHFVTHLLMNTQEK